MKPITINVQHLMIALGKVHHLWNITEQSEKRRRVPGMGNNFDSYGSVGSRIRDKLHYYQGSITSNDECIEISMNLTKSFFTSITPDKFCIGNGTVFVTGNEVVPVLDTKNETTHVTIPDNNVKILLGKKDAVCILDLQSQSTDCSTTDPTGILVLDYEFSASTVYYKSNGRGIKRIKLPLSENKENSLQIESYEHVSSMALDWIHDEMYWIYNNTKLVRTCGEGQNSKTVLTSELIDKLITNPTGTIPMITNVQVDPYEQFIFIKTILVLNGEEKSSLILRSDVEGIRPVTIYSTMNSSLINFNIEPGQKRLYIKENNQIHICNYEGTKIETFTLYLPFGMKDSGQYHMAIHSFYSLGLFQYGSRVSHILRGSIKSDVSNKIITKMLHPSIDNVTSLKVYDVRVQRRMVNGKYLCDVDCDGPCEINEGGDCYIPVALPKKKITQECGKSSLTTSPMMTVMVNGTLSEQANFPWHAILYRRTSDNSWKSSCGGTLITRKLVLTAAHCVMTLVIIKPQPINVQDLMVALGKVHRQWNITEQSEDKKRVKEIVPHWQYGGSAYRYAYDIAVLILENIVSINKYVMPACLDLNLEHVMELITNKNLQGYVPGMGNTVNCVSDGAVCQSESDKLLYYHGSIISNDVCLYKSMSMTKKCFTDLTPDRFCVGDGTGSPMQKGDSGGGMTFVFGGLHYVYGVVSNLLFNAETRTSTFGSLTNVSEHMNWLQKYLDL